MERVLTSSKSASASSGICFSLRLPAESASPHFLTSGGTPDLSSSISTFSSLPSNTVVTVDLEMLTLPPSQAIDYSLPVNVVPMDRENVPVAPEWVFIVASTVSTGGRYS